MRRTRRRIFFITVILLAVGTVMIYSASSIFAYERLKDSAYYLKRHLLYIAVALIVCLWFMKIDYLDLKKYAKASICLSLFLLVLTLIPGIGREIGGAKRWIQWGHFNFQPSELAKFSLVLYLADFLSRKKGLSRNFLHYFLPCFLVTLSLAGLILLQPDLGTAFLIIAIFFLMVFVSGLPLNYIFSFLLVALPSVCYLILRSPYRRKRIVAFLNPWANYQGSGYQIIQSLIAFGSGGLLGLGLGESKQKLLYLPAAHTDFIFSILGEELGLLGTLGVICLFVLFFWEAMKIPLGVKDSFGQFLSLGIIFLIALETLLNIGVTIGVLPTKGSPLPFISYGGSALIFNIIYVGLLLNIARDKNMFSRG